MNRHSEPCEAVQPSTLALDLADHLAHSGDVHFYRWTKGRSAETMPWLQIIEAPMDNKFHYLTAGASKILDGPGYGMEFCYIANEKSCDNIELLAMVSYMHSMQSHRLDVGHTMNIGRPIANSSHLDRLLVSLPYPYGSDFEFVHLSDGSHVRVLWLLPISKSEEHFRHEHGLEQLEELFDTNEIDFSDPLRNLVVT